MPGHPDFPKAPDLKSAFDAAMTAKQQRALEVAAEVRQHIPAPQRSHQATPSLQSGPRMTMPGSQAIRAAAFSTRQDRTHDGAQARNQDAQRARAQAVSREAIQAQSSRPVFNENARDDRSR